jgi:hypothetical protein
MWGRVGSAVVDGARRRRCRSLFPFPPRPWETAAQLSGMKERAGCSMGGSRQATTETAPPPAPAAGSSRGSKSFLQRARGKVIRWIRKSLGHQHQVSSPSHVNARVVSWLRFWSSSRTKYVTFSQKTESTYLFLLTFTQTSIKVLVFILRRFFSDLNCTASYEGVITEWWFGKRPWPNFKVISRQLPGGTEENKKKSQLG